MMSFFALVISLLPIIFVFILIVFIVGIVRGIQRRADERLELDKHRSSLLQQQLNDIDSRLTVIENMLRQVE